MGNEFWFKPKTFGYGATPTTWEGCTLVAVHIAIILACIAAMYLRKESFPVYVSSIAAIIVVTAVMIVVSVQKTDGAWGWNAGSKQIAGKND
jgi:isoprenylcysteine carboxyl methyltransferase (ICMT) family protein YpbQ